MDHPEAVIDDVCMWPLAKQMRPIFNTVEHQLSEIGILQCPMGYCDTIVLNYTNVIEDYFLGRFDGLDTSYR